MRTIDIGETKMENDKVNKSARRPVCGCCMSKAQFPLNRRQFMVGAGATVAAGGVAMSSLTALGAPQAGTEYRPQPARPLKVQPVLAVGLPKRREKTSWRNWGGFHTQADIEKEQQRIAEELKQIKREAEFAVEFLPLVTLNDVENAKKVAAGEHDVLLMYAANSWVDVLEALTNPEKWTIMFLRHRSGPVYLWYEVAHNRYLRKTVDEFGQPGMDYNDVVVDDTPDVLWRLRALYGLKNTLAKKIVCVGGPAGWGQGGKKAPGIARDLWKMNLPSVEYAALGEMIKKARADEKLVDKCRRQAEAYLAQSGVSLETDKQFVVNAFVLTQIFRKLMADAETDAITINWCMGTIIPMAETTACMPLSVLNDEGYLAFCESDFVVIPSGVLLHYISSLPVFLNDPTYPHDGIVTLAHCTAPRKMDGKHREPARIVTHFESDYGAAPKVEMEAGQKITVINPDFDCERWLGFEGEIIGNPFLDICRSQIDVRINGDCETLNKETRGFHWMVCYGNYLREMGYALKKVGINWLDLTKQRNA